MKQCKCGHAEGTVLVRKVGKTRQRKGTKRLGLFLHETRSEEAVYWYFFVFYLTECLFCDMISTAQKYTSIPNTEGYRSGHNEAVLKICSRGFMQSAKIPCYA